MLIDIKLKKKSIAELGHNGLLKNIRQPTHLSPFLQNGQVYLAEILYEVPSQQKIWDQHGILYGSYMGTPYGTGMGFATQFHVVPTWANPYGSQYGNHKWVLFWIWPKRPMPANLCRINF